MMVKEGWQEAEATACLALWVVAEWESSKKSDALSHQHMQYQGSL